MSPSATAGEAFEKLVDIMKRLRSEGGCPWDREQTFDSLKPFLLEEAYEVLDAIDRGDWEDLCTELGDLILQPVFLAQMASEAGKFSLIDSLQAIADKLVRRHPHVFGSEQAETGDDVVKLWSRIKASEKKGEGDTSARLLDSVPRALPALVESQLISSRAASAGFDWSNVSEVYSKLDEERLELESAKTASEREHEIGDLLFVLVNLARFYRVDPEQALRRANSRFRSRFAFVEQGLRERGKAFEESNIDEMEALWQQAKSAEI